MVITSKLIPRVRRYHFYYVVRTYSTYGQGILLSTHVHTYFFMISPTKHMKHTKNVMAGRSAVLIRDEIHCNEYPGTRRVMSVGYPGSKFSTRFNPITDTCLEKRFKLVQMAVDTLVLFIDL